ncbi:phosphatidylinositol-specific phospholipase C/glycerophosphodiester phosphodiesterase family protein [Kineococcus sp. SYSU DK004]|uniref:phosphatidylinositol-specific phospholipase C/glycerophosphodiester phosphodiesterase family protein n=1 Tax=Kineococcus sp. SYSU DK004 TaxID=3383125 RepID=UPI003D7D2BD4
MVNRWTPRALGALVGALVLPLTAAPALAATAPADPPAAVGAPAAAVALPQAHAHNDYEHERPLLDALDHGFTSVEADVWLVDGELLVAHDAVDLDRSRTLQSLYLDPLAERVAANGGSVHPGHDEPLQLLVDVKTLAVPTYLRLHEVLSGYPQLLTEFRVGEDGYDARPGAVTAVVSGNRPVDLMARQPVRWAGYDGRSGDLGSGADPDFMPLLSENWTNLFTWTGEGEMPAAERARLQQLTATAHADGRAVRFWATPDEPGPAREAVWTELLAAGVDHVNTDDLAGLRDFLLTRG